jgi:hypothetical protein
MTTAFDINDYVAGDTLRLDLTVLHPNGDVFPSLDTCQIEWSLGRPTSLGICEPFLIKTLGAGVTLINAATGEVAVNVESGEIPQTGAFIHTLTIITADGQRYTEMRGTISPTVTL